MIIWVVALIPMEELRDPDVAQKYEINLDPELLSMLTTASSQKKVSSSLFPSMYVWFSNFISES